MGDFALFESTELGCVRYEDKGARMAIEGFDRSEDLFITGIRGGEKPNYQLMYSLGVDVYINAFNKRLSVWELNGLFIPSDCEDCGERPGAKPAFIEFYDAHNITVDTDPILITFQTITLEGFLIDLRVQDYTKEGVEGIVFNLKYLARRADQEEEPSSTFRAILQILLDLSTGTSSTPTSRPGEDSTGTQLPDDGSVPRTTENVG